MIYFDNAATTFPKPICVRNAVDTALLCYGANPGRSGHDLSIQTARKVYETREKVAAFFGAQSAEWVVFTQNCTYALGTAIKGLLRAGDHVIISDLEHNSVLRPIHALCLRGVITYTVAETFPDDDATVASFRAAIRPNTRAIVVTHASNVFGTVLPIEKLAALAREYGLYSIVDAAQTAGCEPISLVEMGIDFICTAGHKGLYGPSGTGVLITACGQKLTPLTEGGTGSASMDYEQPDFMPDRLEAGTLNTAGIIGLGAGFDFLSAVGQERLARREYAVACRLYNALSRTKGVTLYAPAPKQGANVPLISFNIEGMTSEETTARLNNKGFALRGGLHCSPLAHKKYGTAALGGTARASVGAFNTTAQADELAQAVRQIIRQKRRITVGIQKKD